jgi:hypothetical protein
MLYIKLKTRAKPQDKFIGYKFTGFTWHVGEPVPPVAESDEIESVQADGDELLYIIDNFANVPYNTRRRVHLWHGEFATFIAHNL